MAETRKLNEQYGPIWRVKFPGIPDVVTTVRPEDAEAVFRNEGRLPDRPGFEVLKHYRNERIKEFPSMGILGNGESWWDTRSIAQVALLKPMNIMDYVSTLGQISDDFIKRSVSIFIHIHYQKVPSQ